ncbi:MAG TPA: VWA domain-containing protein [Acidimicrobiales bacterium]|nr:VWA domain-containing protein [Acidimicrobiales bacterium]
MSFASPLRLLLLVAPLALIGAYFWNERRRAGVAVRFTSVDLLASVAPKRPGWQRHVAPVLLLTTIVVLVLGFAEPLRTVHSPRQQATVVLTMDVSGSMIATDVSPDRLTAAKHAADTFVDALPSGIRVGLVAFSTQARVVTSPTSDRTTIKEAINGLTAEGATNTGDAIRVALASAEGVTSGPKGKKVPAAIVLMSDGVPNQAGGQEDAAAAVDDAVAQAKADGVKINTIAFGTDAGTVTIRGETIPVPSDPASMARIASGSGGKTFTAQSANQLKSVYDDIGRIVGYVTHRKKVTATFTGLGLLIGAAAAAAALTWGHRIA